MRQASSQGSSQRTKLLLSRFGNVDSFLQKFTPDYQKSICPSSEECFFGDYPTLAEVGSAYGDKVPAAWMIPQLYNLSEYCGCREKLQGKPLEECAFVIATEYYYLKVSELMLFFHHIIIDGWCLHLVFADLKDALINGAKIDIASIQDGYTDIGNVELCRFHPR